MAVRWASVRPSRTSSGSAARGSPAPLSFEIEVSSAMVPVLPSPSLGTAFVLSSGQSTAFAIDFGAGLGPHFRARRFDW